MALVDSVRHCIPDVAFSPEFMNRNGLEAASGEAIVRAAESRCIGRILTDVARNEVIALESVRRRADSEANIVAVSRQDDYLHFILAFTTIRGYEIPPEYKDFIIDSSILNRFQSDGIPPITTSR